MILCEASLSADRAVRQADIPPLREVPYVNQTSSSMAKLTERANETYAGMRVIVYLENFVDSDVNDLIRHYTCHFRAGVYSAKDVENE